LLLAKSAPAIPIIGRDDRIGDLPDAAMPDEERVGLDDIRGPEDLAICMKFMIEVYREGACCGPSKRRMRGVRRTAAAHPPPAGMRRSACRSRE
jgi:hypothetical protein